MRFHHLMLGYDFFEKNSSWHHLLDRYNRDIRMLIIYATKDIIDGKFLPLSIKYVHSVFAQIKAMEIKMIGNKRTYILWVRDFNQGYDLR